MAEAFVHLFGFGVALSQRTSLSGPSTAIATSHVLLLRVCTVTSAAVELNLIFCSFSSDSFLTATLASGCRIRRRSFGISIFPAYSFGLLSETSWGW